MSASRRAAHQLRYPRFGSRSYDRIGRLRYRHVHVALREQLRRNEAASVGIDELLKGAAAARAAGKLEGSDGALPLYQRVLELEPDNTQALEGREDTLSDLWQQARSRLDAGDLAGASVVVRRVQQSDAGHV